MDVDVSMKRLADRKSIPRCVFTLRTVRITESGCIGCLYSGYIPMGAIVVE